LRFPILWKLSTCCGSSSITPVQMLLYEFSCPLQSHLELPQQLRCTSLYEFQKIGCIIPAFKDWPLSLICKSKSHNSSTNSGLSVRGPVCDEDWKNKECLWTCGIYLGFNWPFGVNHVYNELLVNMSNGLSVVPGFLQRKMEVRLERRWFLINVHRHEEIRLNMKVCLLVVN
jgi:hypothetical protein